MPGVVSTSVGLLLGASNLKSHIQKPYYWLYSNQICSGYAQGHVEKPSYEDPGNSDELANVALAVSSADAHGVLKDVCSGQTGHTEAVRIVYDPKQARGGNSRFKCFVTHGAISKLTR